MKRISFICSVWMFSGLVGSSDVLAADGEKKNAPNIILIMSDDQGWGDAGYQGHPELKTPNLDQMADNGLEFNRFYSAAPVCSPTRGSVLTGRHPYRYGIPYANAGHIREQEVLLPEVLRQHGYTTGHFGKWHLGTMTKLILESNRGGIARSEHYAPPWENDFDVVFSTESKSPTWDPMVNPPLEVNGANQDQKPGDSFGTYYWITEGCIATDNLEGDDSRVIMDRAIPFMESAIQQDQPFFSVIWFHTPHSPVIAGSKYREMYDHLPENKQHYYGCLTAMDEQIGRLRKKLRDLGVADNTMVWFCSDNGPAAEGGGPGLKAGARQQGSTGGLRGRKGTLFEGGVRVPGILEWPAQIDEPRETDFPAVTSDYYPTILDILGFEVDNQPVLDGISLKKLIEGEKVSERSKPIGFQSSFGGQHWAVWNDNQYKLIYKEEDDEYLLFDLYNDPNESDNIAGERPETVERMKNELNEWRASVESDRKKYMTE
ncbi:MAG: sulfatase [Bacteroidales bacterium]